MDKAQINWLRQEAIQDGSIPNKLGFKVSCPGWLIRYGPRYPGLKHFFLKSSKDDNE